MGHNLDPISVKFLLCHEHFIFSFLLSILLLIDWLSILLAFLTNLMKLSIVINNYKCFLGSVLPPYCLLAVLTNTFLHEADWKKIKEDNLKILKAQYLCNHLLHHTQILNLSLDDRKTF